MNINLFFSHRRLPPSWFIRVNLLENCLLCFMKLDSHSTNRSC